MSFSFRSFSVLAVVAFGLAAGCARQDAAPAEAAKPAVAAGEVNLYTTREPGLITPLLETFSKDTGVKVNTVFVKDGLIERVVASLLVGRRIEPQPDAIIRRTGDYDRGVCRPTARPRIAQ